MSDPAIRDRRPRGLPPTRAAARPLVLLLALSLGAAVPARPASSRAAAAETSPAALDAGARAAAPGPVPRIVNGLPTQDFPAAAALLDRATGLQLCSAVLAGCSTVLTAAHCVCSGIGAECQPGGPALAHAAELEVFLAHAGFFSVESIAVQPAFRFGIRDDIAVLRLSEPVEGVTPSPLNSVARLPHGTTAEIVGFGLATESIFDNGIKRAGGIVTGPCTVVPGDEYVCWEFDQPLGPPGTDANTCSGDSGGPLYFDFGSGPLLAGIGSGGVNANCQPDDLPFDAEVFSNLAEIAALAGPDVGAAECGELPAAGGPGALQVLRAGELAQGETADFAFQVPAGARALRVGLNAEEGLLFNDFDLALGRSGPPGPGTVECSSMREGTYEFCEVLDPAAGAWNARVTAAIGGGAFQLTTTILREADLGPCVPGPHVLCIDDAPEDGRFQAEIAFDTSQAGGLAGLGNAVDLDPLGITSGGIFWFFNQENPEVLLKVLDGCEVNGHYWVFWSAGTNVRLVVTVTDRRTARQRVYA
ncbi:MAG TPA: trypsin-like serine protease, partial [Thermoanaerobaculia bacterium]|nr:trypsin-like serine protease [Thermoanaerobaculia bacterium]